MIQRGLDYLRTTRESRLGGQCLIGLAFVKNRQPDHPKVKEAVDAALAFAAQPMQVIQKQSKAYSMCIAPIFLCELDADLYRSDIEKLLSAVWQRQAPNGAWTYDVGGTGDTSMTQYGVLACWSAQRAGFDVPRATVLRVCEWLLRTQGKSGGFAYRPPDPASALENPNGRTGPPNERPSYRNLRESTTVAGLGSVYVCSALLGMNEIVGKSSGDIQEIPEAFVPISASGQALNVRVNRNLAARVKRSIVDGNRWYQSHYTVNPKSYPFYYLYALERYQSFRELAEGKSPARPQWYTDGVKHLADTQLASGAWRAPQSENSVGTAFAVLFLQRSTKKSIQGGILGEGLLVGGRGLPGDTRRIRMVDGRVVSALEKKSLTAIANLLSDADENEIERLAANEAGIFLDPDSELTREDEIALRALVRTGDSRVKLLAIKALSTQRNLDNVPEFIDALSDDDVEVAMRARDALRKVSRKFVGFGLPDRPTLQQREYAAARWKKWYRTIRPDAEFYD